MAEVEVFAVDRPTDFDGGIMGVGFAISGHADGGAARNPLLHLTYQGEKLRRGYIIRAQGLEAGLTSANTDGFAFVELQRNADGEDWTQPLGTLGLPNNFSVNAPVLVDTGLDEMLLWLSPADRPPGSTDATEVPAGVAVNHHGAGGAEPARPAIFFRDWRCDRPGRPVSRRMAKRHGNQHRATHSRLGGLPLRRSPRDDRLPKPGDGLIANGTRPTALPAGCFGADS
jgi:hypothetical protein